MNHPQGNRVTEAIDWNREFPITSVTRADLVSAGFSREQVVQLTDDDMQEIASAMEDIYCDHGYWEDVELCTKRILQHKEEDAVLVQEKQPEGEEPEK